MQQHFVVSQDVLRRHDHRHVPAAPAGDEVAEALGFDEGPPVLIVASVPRMDQHGESLSAGGRDSRGRR
jgi:hypothetical protein